MAKDAMRSEATLRVRRAQKRRIIYLVLLQLVACLFALPYSLSVVAWSPPVFRYEERFFLDACLCLSHMALFSSYWMSTHVWFKLLPSLPYIAKLYGKHSFVFDHPEIVPKVAQANVAVIVVTEFLFTFLLPTIYFDDAELRRAFDYAAIVAKMVYCILFIVPTLLYLRAVTSLFSDSVYQIQDIEQVELRFIGKGKKTIQFIRATLFLLTTIWIGLFIPALVTDYGRRNLYALYSPALCAVLAGMLSSNFNVGIRMAETVDLASIARSQSRSGSRMGNNAVTSQISRRSLRLLLQDDDELATDS